jgi:high affinity Mn2+ porin
MRNAVAGVATILALAASHAARAADMPVKALPYFDWTGFYFGGHVGYAQGSAKAASSDLQSTESNPSFASLFGGVQAGYNLLLPSRILLGAEADVTFPNHLDPNNVVASLTTAQSNVSEQIDYIATLRGRLGYVFGNWLIYGTAGFAASQDRFIETPGVVLNQDKVLQARAGVASGAGVEVAIAADWTTRLEYLYDRFEAADVRFPSGTRYASSWDLHFLRLGLNHKFDGPTSDAAPSQGNGPQTAPDVPNWEIHGQTTFIPQAYPGFSALYSGTNSLSPFNQAKETWTTSAFLGIRLWEGGELYYNPELLQGFGLSDTVGAAGFPNGEAQKSNFPYPRYSTSRLFLRQTFGLGGEQETVDSDYGQLGGKRDISRLTVQAGRFAVHDIFDNNAYAQDPRADFFNWSIWAAGAFDYAADKIGLGYGTVAELNQKDWALRGGYFLMNSESNGNNFDMNLFSRGEYVVELEIRYALFTRPGKLRTTAWLNSDFSGSYRDALDAVVADPTLDINDALVASREGRIKYGYVFNVEQSITDDLGLFSRWSWNNGKNEIMAFTDIDASLSLGAVLKGTAWGRPDDRVGAAGAVNAISKDHRDFLAAGGLGILIGDGRLNYQHEKILETYYAIALSKWLSLTFDYQFIVDPAYNADRGPVSIFASRLHATF